MPLDDLDGPQDVAMIAIMGATGTGKSTFIKLLTNDDNIIIGYSTESETRDITVSQYYGPNALRPVDLIDTPGFDDSRDGVTDTDILEKIVQFLQPQEGGKKLNGIIYMHRISDPRLGGVSRKNLKMFRNLCGDDKLSNVRIVTTNWSRVSEQEGKDREANLAKTAFKPLIDAGARLLRHDDTIEMAQSIVSQLVVKDAVMMQIQEELLKGMKLQDTLAGAVITEDIKLLMEKHRLEIESLKREMAEALREHDEALRVILAAERQALEQKMARADADRKRLEKTLEALTVAKGTFPVFTGGLFQFVYSDQFPPYPNRIPEKFRRKALNIFDITSLLQTVAMLGLPFELFDLFKRVPRTMQDLVARNLKLHARAQTGPFSWHYGMYSNKNIGHREDWYKDAVFGQQQFTGPNPNTITLALPRWIDEFMAAARAQQLKDVMAVLKGDPENLFVQDYSDFRSLMGISQIAELKSGLRYGCSSVVLFHLESEGKLHPLAITLDYKRSMEGSVTIFNRRVYSTILLDESSDWPWRYAKMCAQVSDWLRHEVATHLVDTHFVEEVIIVALYRNLRPDHILFQLLEPHWDTTLALNNAARTVLVPKVINQLTGCTEAQTYAFIKGSYKKFNWTESYVPNDLLRRGFPIPDLDKPKYHNYGYARNIARMWEILRKFASSVLTEFYKSDAQVANDIFIAAFCQEVRSQYGGQLESFPTIETLDELIDFVTMCIHIASPQHSAVNYLQQYYQTFVPNKPSALYSRLPRSLDELQRFREGDMLSALPICQHKDWLIMAHLPYMLSKEVASDGNILHYATKISKSDSTPEVIRVAARGLVGDLEAFAGTVSQYSQELDDQATPYLVLDPKKTAVSILI